jgi:hypothetical protein
MGENSVLVERVDTLIDERVSNIETSQTLVSRGTKRVLMAGFSVNDTVLSPDEASRFAADTRKKAYDYKARRDQFALALQGAQIPYKAILPRKLFEQLCREFGLIRFEHFDKNGTVSTSKTSAQIHRKLGIGTLLPIAIITGFLVGVACNALLVGMSIVGALVTGTIGAAVGIGGWYFYAHNLVAKPSFIQWIFGEATRIQTSSRVLPIFPPLPVELVPVLHSLKPLHDQNRLFTAALPEAVKLELMPLITLAEGSAATEKITRSAEETAHMETLEQERQERIRQRIRDEEPIVFSHSYDEKMVAAHFQFGNFPKEKEFMQRIESITDAELFSLVD